MKKIAIAGFRHPHILDLYQRARTHDGLSLVAICEENESSSLKPPGASEPFFASFDKLLDDVACDMIALGGCYGGRGAQAIAALRSGRHVISDKPLCTSLAELSEIEALASEKNLRIGLMLDLRDSGNFIALREVVRSGRIGKIQTVSVSGQHPLMPGKRQGWYFEEGQHGGTLNDIAIHALDIIPWITDTDIASVVAARTWNAKAAFAPHFKDCGQFLMQMANGGGVIGDVSYLAPEACGFGLPHYWRMTLHGLRGMVETSWNASGVVVADDSMATSELLPASPPRPGGYLDDFLAEVEGHPRRDGLSTKGVLRATRLALELEQCASQS